MIIGLNIDKMSKYTTTESHSLVTDDYKSLKIAMGLLLYVSHVLLCVRSGSSSVFTHNKMTYHSLGMLSLHCFTKIIVNVFSVEGTCYESDIISSEARK